MGRGYDFLIKESTRPRFSKSAKFMILLRYDFRKEEVLLNP